MYKLDPNIIHLTEEFNFKADSILFFEFLEKIKCLPSEELVLSPNIIDIALSEFPFNYMEERNISLQPFMQVFILWISNLEYHPINDSEKNHIDINPEMFSQYHKDEFRAFYKNVLAYSVSEKDYFLTTKAICKFELSSFSEVNIVKPQENINISILSDGNIQSHINDSKLIFEHNPKHSLKGVSDISHLPVEIQNRCQSILDSSLVDKDNPSIRYGFDEESKQYIKFRRHSHSRNVYHGYIVEYNEREIPSNIRIIWER